MDGGGGACTKAVRPCTCSSMSVLRADCAQQFISVRIFKVTEQHTIDVFALLPIFLTSGFWVQRLFTQLLWETFPWLQPSSPSEAV